MNELILTCSCGSTMTVKSEYVPLLERMFAAWVAAHSRCADTLREV